MLSTLNVEESLPRLPQDIDRWNERMMRTIMPIVRDEEAARDICQDVWIRYMEHRPDQSEQANIGGWLVTVARRLALNHVQSGQIRFRAAVTVDAINPASSDLSPFEVTGRRQESENIRSVLASLNPRHARVIELCDIEGLSYVDAGSELGISEAAVTSLLHRARTAFRRRYLLSIAPSWLRALADSGPISVDEVLNEIDPFTPPAELGDAVETRAHDVFAQIAGTWDRIRTARVPGDLDGLVADRARLAPDDNALDVGTGTGVVAMHVAPKVKRVVGVDRSLPMLRVARDRVATSGSRNVLMEFGDLLDLPIRPESIDVAFCSLVLRLVAKPSDAVANITRTLRPGGRIVVCDTLRASDSDTGVSPAHLSAWLKNAGLSQISLDVLGNRTAGRYLVAVGHRA